MGIKTSIDPDRGFARHVATGVVEVADFLDALREVYAHPIHRPEDGGIWDARGADATSLTAADLRDFVDFIREQRGPQPGRTALVVGRDVEYGLARMYQVFAESVVEFEVFRSWDDAVAWVTGEPGPDAAD